MNKDYKIIEVFKHQPLADKLEWNRFQKSQLIVVLVEDETYMYYASDFIGIMYSAYSEGMSSARIIL